MASVAPPIESDEELQRLYTWVDETPLSRPKRNISRDFADGVLFAEIVNNFFPKVVEMHNYSSANNLQQKTYNWSTLNVKVMRKLGYQIHQSDIDEIVKASPGAIERVLKVLMDKVSLHQRGQLKIARPSVSPPGGHDGQCVGSRPPVVPQQRQGLIDRARDVLAEREEHADDRAYGGGAAQAGGARVQRYQQEVDAELLVEKEQTIAELREMVVIMSEKIKKLEQLVRIKDSKIEALNAKLTKYGIN